MAALAETLEVAQAVVARIMIEMCRGQNDAGLPHLYGVLDVWPACYFTATLPPSVELHVEPATVGQAADGLAILKLVVALLVGLTSRASRAAACAAVTRAAPRVQICA